MVGLKASDSQKIMAKKLAREKLQLALDNLKLAESEMAKQLAPQTYHWAKIKIYENRKIILKHLSNDAIISEASDDACAAAAQLLSTVRTRPAYFQKDPEQEAVNALVNEGGPP